MHTLTGQQFKDMIRGAGLKLEDVAKEAGISGSAPSLWYNGHREPTLATYNKLMDAYERLKEAKGD